MNRRELLGALVASMVPVLASANPSPRRRLVLDYTSKDPYLFRGIPYWPAAKDQQTRLLAKECWRLENGDLEIFSYQLIGSTTDFAVVRDENGFVLKREVAAAGTWHIDRLNRMGHTVGVDR
jgi:hypothetical protein